MYEYAATIVRVVDGDTVDVLADLGFEITHGIRLRLAGINAPELHAPDSAPGVAARDYLMSLLPPGTEVVLDTQKDKTEKYGRYLSVVHVPVAGVDVDVNQQMIDSGHAVPYSGGKR